MDKDTTKTREDRIIQLSPRALAVLKRHWPFIEISRRAA
jgi:hypothetical protein